MDKVLVRVVNMEKIWSACESMPLSVCVHLSAPACVRVCVHATEGSGAAAYSNSTGWQGGCQNGPVSCVSSKIGPNTAEMHDALWLFTAPTQCAPRMLPSVCNQTHSEYVLAGSKRKRKRKR